MTLSLPGIADIGAMGILACRGNEFHFFTSVEPGILGRPSHLFLDWQRPLSQLIFRLKVQPAQTVCDWNECGNTRRLSRRESPISVQFLRSESAKLDRCGMQCLAIEDLVLPNRC